MAATNITIRNNDTAIQDEADMKEDIRLGKICY